MAILTDALNGFKSPEHIDFTFGNPTLLSQYEFSTASAPTYPLPCGVPVFASTSTEVVTGQNAGGTTPLLGITFNKVDNATSPFSIVVPDGELVLRVPITSLDPSGTWTISAPTQLYVNPSNGLITTTSNGNAFFTALNSDATSVWIQFNMSYVGQWGE